MRVRVLQWRQKKRVNMPVRHEFGPGGARVETERNAGVKFVKRDREREEEEERNSAMGIATQKEKKKQDIHSNPPHTTSHILSRRQRLETTYCILQILKHNRMIQSPRCYVSSLL